MATINQVDIFRFLTKPWEVDQDLKPFIRQAIEYYNFRIERNTFNKRAEKRNDFYIKNLRTIEGKLERCKKDFDIYKNLHEKFLGSIKNLEDSKKTKDYIKIFGRINEVYLRTLKENNESIAIDIFKNRITNFFKTIKLSYSIEEIRKGEELFEFITNYKLLMAIQILVINELRRLFYIDSIDIKILSDESRILLRFRSLITKKEKDNIKEKLDYYGFVLDISSIAYKSLNGKLNMEYKEKYLACCTYI